MPKILELQVINDVLWAKVGELGSFPTSVQLWTPPEVEGYRNSIIEECAAIFDEYKPVRHLLTSTGAELIRNLKETHRGEKWTG